ncbi:YBT1 [Candida oxycetoniae]|uniref:YBT1 n=1 Tax=Candida oxycetoniae TaxID=497107 RepID=A0AAI9SYP8_9ASCO|nr:YBT1 [Candida oxycetoniae]KAI3405616.2 YBT1 [Candida oxycetoniae]
MSYQEISISSNSSIGHECPFWDFDDITKCARSKLDLYPPVIFGGVSLFILVTKSLVLFVKQKRANGGEIQLDTDVESRPLLASNGESPLPLASNSDNRYGATSNMSKEDLKALHFDLSRLPNTNIDGTPHGYVKHVYKDIGERVRVSAEYILVLLSLFLHFAPFVVRALQMEFKNTYIPLVQTCFWIYVFFIVSIRVANLRKVLIRLPNLWVHTTALYFCNFFPSLLTFRSALITSQMDWSLRVYYISEFIINSALLTLNFTAKIGDKPSELYVTPGVTPSPENVSSIASFISYSWLDPMVWRAYKSPLQKNDIWGLREDDYALYVLKGFEASKSTLRFTFKIFMHFKFLFAIQAFWAIVDSVLVFGPSVLLKKVLEYVADPSLTSTNLAWTFVFMMPITKMADTIASGCSLFLGRRVCCRMKAVIIGEVYAKALRRKITVTETGATKEKKKDTLPNGNDKKTSKQQQQQQYNEEEENTDVEDKKEEKEIKKTAELGAIINLMAIDAFKVSEICGYLHYFVGAILMILICTVLLYNLLGWSALVGSLTIVVLLPINYSLAQWMGRLQKQMLGVTDKRIQKLNETFQSIRIIKFFAWEDKFFESAMDIREEELRYLKKRCAVWCVAAFVWFITPTLITLLSFYCYTIIEKNTLTAPVAFTALSLFTLLRSPLDQLADMTSFVIQSKVSLDRVADFLDEAETSKYDQLAMEKDINSPEIGFQNANLSWNSASKADFKLRDINIAFKTGKLNVIIGPTGSGKTSLLLGLLGEMDLISGKVFLPGIIPREELVLDEFGLTESVAYCSQSAWLLNDTIRGNIIFGAHFNQERYDKVIEACGLVRDLQILGAGDQTEIGEKGIALSGGQKQRVSLARALYSNSKHLLLDDCLSAVDSHTALWIYENCITGPLMENRTCILVSHNVALTAQNAEWIVVMENGRVKNQGTTEELLTLGDLGDDELIKTSVLNSRTSSSANLQSLNDKNNEMKTRAAIIEQKLKNLKQNDDNDEEGEGGENDNDESHAKKSDGKLIEEEGKAEGVVGLKVYIAYAKVFGGWPVWTTILLAFVLSQSVYMLQSFWLRIWSLNSEKATQAINSLLTSTPSVLLSQSNNNVIESLQFGVRYVVNGIKFISSGIDQVSAFKEEHSTLYYITVYAIIGFAYSFTASFRVFVTFFSGIEASNRIFKSVLTTILRAKLRFFDKTPIGRIMNRFSKDIESVDQEVTPFAEGVFICFVQCFSTLILISFITPGFLIFALIISLLYYLVGYFYLTLSRELKRYESITKSPIHQHFSESLNGVATIRAYGIESRFMKQNLQAIDNNNRPFFYLWVANRWLSFRIDAVGSLVMFFAGVFVLLSVGKIDAGLAGLSLSYAIAFSESALWIVRLYANVEMNMNSVERLQEYLEVEQEPPYEIKETEPPKNWPDQGHISVKDVSLRYSPELPRVIKNVSFDIQPHNKVGIVGRTGAGKSTIITAFFRFLDPENGTIKIDGVDITTIGLRNLRQAITIIPQDPTLFVGTIRSNLDPFDEYTDGQIFEALKRVNLISDETSSLETSTVTAATTIDVDAVAVMDENQNKFHNLENAITEGGGNLSQGERQLVCLARSLLKNPKIILLDEATSSIDYKSDSMIQQTIREQFGESTILTIAHRLRTIIDYDKILVMDAGQVVEYDNPYVLIINKESLFYNEAAHYRAERRYRAERDSGATLDSLLQHYRHYRAERDSGATLDSLLQHYRAERDSGATLDSLLQHYRAERDSGTA